MSTEEQNKRRTRLFHLVKDGRNHVAKNGSIYFAVSDEDWQDVLQLWKSAGDTVFMPVPERHVCFTGLRRKFCVRTTAGLAFEEDKRVRDGVKATIKAVDTAATFGLQSNPVTFWVTTSLTREQLQTLAGVVDVVVAADRGDIWLDRKGDDNYVAKTEEDSKRLANCGAPTAFHESAYDEVLKKVSDFGYALATEVEENV